MNFLTYMIGPDVNKLKAKIKELEIELVNETGWLKRRRIRRQLKDLQDEIDYQEGRKQYANRPYSKPSVRIPSDKSLLPSPPPRRLRKEGQI